MALVGVLCFGCFGCRESCGARVSYLWIFSSAWVQGKHQGFKQLWDQHLIQPHLEEATIYLWLGPLGPLMHWPLAYFLYCTICTASVASQGMQGIFGFKAEVLCNGSFHHHPDLGWIFRRSASDATLCCHQTLRTITIPSLTQHSNLGFILLNTKMLQWTNFSFRCYLHFMFLLAKVNWLRERVGLLLRDAWNESNEFTWIQTNQTQLGASSLCVSGFVHSVVQFVDEKAWQHGNDFGILSNSFEYVLECSWMHYWL